MNFSLHIPERFRPVIGTLLCATLAAVVSVVGQTKPGKSYVPILFLAAVLVVIFRFGSLAGVLSTILSATIFAMVLFEPLGHLSVKDGVEKNNLMWMVLVGLALSIFGYRANTERRSHKRNSKGKS